MCIAHFIRQQNDTCGNQTNTVTNESAGTAQILNFLPLQGGRATNNAFAVRKICKDYFTSPVGGIIPSDNNV
jgi:hypothetical protein